MARPRFLRRDAAPRPAAIRRPPAGVLRRERRLLLKLREDRVRDLGGLLLEMYRRGSFREELLSERCADLVAIETRLADIHHALAGPPRHAPHCVCGATLLPGARFCASCGRPLVASAGTADEATIIEPPPLRDGAA
jgi:hypothetical protein